MTRITVRCASRPSRYLGRRGWVASLARARNFASVQQAMHYCFENSIEAVEVVVRFDDSRSVPVIVRVPEDLEAPGSIGEQWFLAEAVA